jgi:ATP adenylyltransferase
MVIVTRRFRSQAAPMSVEDVTALWACVVAVDGVGFYNGGFRSGASQPRRHMQVVPLSSVAEGFPPALRGALTTTALAGVRLPLDAAVKGILEAKNFAVTPGEPVQIPAYAGIAHGFAFLGGDAARATAPEGGAAVFAVYKRLLAHAGLGRLAERAEAESAGASAAASIPASPEADDSSHNVVLTQRWMLVVPRSKESWGQAEGGVSVNALGYAGLLLARSNSPARAELEAAGPMAALKGCAVAAV